LELRRPLGINLQWFKFKCSYCLQSVGYENIFMNRFNFKGAYSIAGEIFSTHLIRAQRN